MKLKAFALFVIMTVGSAVAASAATNGLRPSDPLSVREALLHGKLNYLQKESHAAPSKNTRTFAHLGYLAAQMRTDELSSYAEGCFQSKNIRKKRPITAFMCGLFAASAGLSSQNVSQWARMLSSSLEFGLPILRKRNLIKSASGYPDPAEIERFIDVPRAHVRRGKNGFIPWVPCLYKARKKPVQAAISVKVNGEPVCFTVDTGAAASILTKKTAKRLGISQENGVYQESRGSVSGNKTQYRLGIAKDVEIGPVRFHGMPFLVGKVGVNLIGTDALKSLGTLLFTAKGLEINPVLHPSCTRSMAYAYQYSIYTAPLGPVFSALVNGKATRVLFDSGQWIALVTNSKSYVKNSDSSSVAKTKIRDYNLHDPATAYKTHAQFALNSMSTSVALEMQYAPTYKTPIPVHVGYGVLEHYSVWLDFDNHTACFIPAN